MSFKMMSISGALMIAAIIIIRALATDRLPKRTFLALWGIALCRLLIPFSLPAKSSVFTLLARIFKGVGTTALVVTPITPQAVVAAVVRQIQVTTEKTAIQEINTGINLPLPTLIWLIGTLLVTAFLTVSYFSFRRRFKQAVPVCDEYVGLSISDWITQWRRTYHLKRTVTVKLSDRIRSPLTYGVLSPVILLPKDMDFTDITTLEYALTHELVHIRRFDQLKKLLMSAALCIHWFNPLVWIMCVFFNRDIELACDEGVVRAFGEPDKSAYACALIGMEERKAHLIPMYSGFSKFSGKYFMEERICCIMKMKKTTIGGLLLAIVLLAGTTAVFATSGINDESEPSLEPEAVYEDDSMMVQDGENYEPLTVMANNTSGEVTIGDVKDQTPVLMPADYDGPDTTWLEYVYNMFLPVYWTDHVIINENTCYLETPVTLEGYGNLLSIVFSETGLDMVFDIPPADGAFASALSGKTIILTGSDGTNYRVGGIDTYSASFFNWDLNAYVFNPTQDVTFQFEDAVYDIQLTKVPVEFLELHNLTN